MSYSFAALEQMGASLYEALSQHKPIAPLAARFDGLGIADAYAIQQNMVAARLAAGEKIIGRKIGVTSAPVMAQLGVNQPDFGVLTSGMYYSTGAAIDFSQFIQPKAEAELAFVMKQDLQGPNVTAADVWRATEGVMPCFEIVDSRISNWEITIVDTIADNASCGVFVLGDRLVSLDQLDVRTAGMVFEKNGTLAGTGAGAATLGSPLNAVAWLANTLSQHGISLKAGDIVLSGALSAMVPVKQFDTLHMTIQGLGECSCRFV